MKKFLYRIITGLGSRNLLNWISDKTYINILFFIQFGKKVNFKNPKTFNEKLQWIKIYDRDKKYVDYVDKYEVRKYVEEKLGKEVLIPLLWVGNQANDIPFDKLPEKFIIKCNHGSHTNIICNDKNNFQYNEAILKLNKWMKKSWYWYGREWPYKEVKKKIIVEKLMEDTNTGDLKDYKFFCFNGKVELFKIDFDRFEKHKANYYDRNCKLLNFIEMDCPPDFSKKLDIPKNIEKMINMAEKLSADIPFVRVDFYNINNKVYFGEMTFFPAAGFGILEPKSWDNKMGKMIKLKSNAEGK